MEDTAKARYEELAPRRLSYLARARDCAALTVPALCPPDGHNNYSKLPKPKTSLGARCVVYLSSTLMTALLPPGQSHFILNVPLEALVEAGIQEVDKDTEQNLALAERSINSEIERKNWRNPTNLTLQLLLVTGNACEYVRPDNTIKTYKLDQYVVSRDLLGNLLELIVVDSVSPDTLPAAYQKPGKKAAGSTDNVDVYTWCKRRPDGRWEIMQEIDGQPLPKSEKIVDTLPFLVYRYRSIPGCDYGWSKVDEHYADLETLAELTHAMRSVAAMNARNLILIRPNSTGNSLRRFITGAENGSVGVGNPEDVNMLRFENVNGAQMISAEIQRLSESIASAFLLGSGMRRDAERVTATELRMVAEELEGALGGVYSMLSEDMQRGRLTLCISNMEKAGRLPPISNVVEPQIIVGLEALGRERDAARVTQVLAGIQALPPDVLDYVKWEDMLKTLFIGAGLPASVRTDDEVTQIRQRKAMEQAMASISDPSALGGMTPELPQA